MVPGPDEHRMTGITLGAGCHDRRVRLVLMRHGQTSSNLSGALDTAAPGAELTELGHRQAAAAVPHLLERGVSEVWSSHLLRARQTAQVLATHLGTAAGTHEGLAEITAGELEMRTDAASVRGYGEGMLAWMGGDLAARLPGGEDGHEFLTRFDHAVEHVLTRADRAGRRVVLAVSHGAAMGAWVRHRAVNAQDWRGRGRLRNTGTVVLDVVPDGFAITEWLPGPLAGPEYDEPDALTAGSQ